MSRLVVISFLLLLASCAQIVTPAGGPVDRVPPKAKKYSPDSAGRNIRPSTITIEFNEYIQLKDLQKNLIIAPAFKNQPDISASGKILSIKLKDTLEENTTYIFDFGSAIADITESNSKPFKYIFSTGPEIDTIEISGTIENAFTREKESDFFVYLYKSLSDSAPYKEKPYYYTRAEKSGSYTFTNIKAGRYKLFALKDANNNFIPDLNEPIAFISEPIEVNSDTSFSLRSFTEIPSKTLIGKPTSAMPGKLLITYNKPVKKIEIDFPVKRKSLSGIIKEYSKTNDSLTIWYKEALSDSVIMIATTDVTRDTIERKLPKEKSGRDGNPFKIIGSNINAQGYIKGGFLYFEASAPIDSFDTALINIQGGAKTNTFKVKPDSTYYRTFRLTHKILDDSVYQLTMLPGALKFFNGYLNDTISIRYSRKSSKSYGTITLKLKNAPEDGILQIIAEKGEIKGETHVNKGSNIDIVVEELEPGTYRARYMEDPNNNKKWDTGNYLDKLQPERVSYFDKSLDVKASWDLEEVWDLNK
jgi:uncharacterized protein (DUF2141 family)